ncbi:hypothetical protein HRG84_19115 [Flavisolibacter sp. BT320]|nr:hypothetical protein [Flavisolibacter longurius]
MKILFNDKWWSDYYVYEPFTYEFLLDWNNRAFDREDFIDLKRYHYFFTHYLYNTAEENLIKIGFSKESARQLKEAVEFYGSYPVFEVFEEPADFKLTDEEEGWQWEIKTNEIHIFKRDKWNNIIFVVDASEDDGYADLQELKPILETDFEDIHFGDEINIRCFQQGHTAITGFYSELDVRYYYSEENAKGEKVSAIGNLEELMEMVEHESFKVKNFNNFLDFMEEVSNK